MVAATVGTAAAVRGRKFYIALAGVFVLIAFGGFAPTYWAKLADGSFSANPIVHLHGALFFAWTLFFFAQTAWVASGKVMDHRAWGMAGISIATLMACTVMLATLNGIRVAEAAGMGDAARRFAIVPLSALVQFAVLFGLAIYWNRRAELHKRLMVMSMIPPMEAAIARVFMTLTAPPGAPPGPPPVFVATPPGLIANLLIVAAMVYDWRTRGRPHPAYLIGLPLLAAGQVLRVPAAATEGWMSIARAFESLAGA